MQPIDSSSSYKYRQPDLELVSFSGADDPSLPQILTIGGDKTLNYRLFHGRAKKVNQMAAQTLIECDNLGKTYQLDSDKPVIALKEITLTGNKQEGGIKRGEFVIIRGPSGGGKTTFLNLLGTIDKASAGRIWIEGEQIAEIAKDQELSRLRRDKIGIVFQSFNLLALMSAYQNVQLPMRIKGVLSDEEMRTRTKLLLKRVGLQDRADHLPSQLSGGEQQRVAIARSLANSPAIVLLDEPTGDLDSKTTIEIMKLLLEINNFGYQGGESQGCTIIMVTHNPDLECYGDRLIFFEDGKIERQVINELQFALEPEEYSLFLNTKI